MWWQDALIYQIYPRSFQDSNGDGVGDLPGITSRLDHIQRLGASAIWLSPFYPSPNADFGYDVSDYTDVDPAYGDLDDFEQLVTAARERNLRVLLDFVPAHTSIEHPWFRAHPEFYFWSDEPPNNWLATFGGSAWARDPETGRYYLHSFFPEQADLNWRNPAVRAEMTKALSTWRGRGADGFRLDAVDRVLKDAELRDDPPATDPFPLPLHEEYARLSHVYSGNVPDIGLALEAMRAAVGDALLIGEAYLPTAALDPYLDTLDVVFAFEPMNAGPDADRLKQAITTAHATGKIGWVLSNHDFTRFATRFGPDARAATLLFLALPGPAFIFQGDEIGMPDGPGTEPPLDRHDRDRFRHPMQWDASAKGGFTSGTPWLPLVDPETRNVAAQEADPGSPLQLVRRMAQLRGELGPELRFVDSPPHTLVLERGGHLVAVNLGDHAAQVKRPGTLVAEARPGDGADARQIPAHGGWIARRQSPVYRSSGQG
jgi:alpha-glucosidase